MTKRAAICIGIDHAEGMIPLQAAVKGAIDFELWAKSQGCITKLLVDEKGKRIYVSNIFEAINAVVLEGTYEQLIIYFSGHGILTAPSAEYWLLSGAPQNPNEAVNLLRSVEDARNSGIPHVIFISDACRSAVQGPPLSGVVGGVIFPNMAIGPQRGEIDVFYATRPGDPAWEVPEAQATQHYRGIFTDCLLKALKAPDSTLCDPLTSGPPPLAAITSRRLKYFLEANVPIVAGSVNIKLRQQPEVRVETAFPKYFAAVVHKEQDNKNKPIYEDWVKGRPIDITPPVPRLRNSKKRSLEKNLSLRNEEGDSFAQEVSKLLNTQGFSYFENHTGFTIFGAEIVTPTASSWEAGSPFFDPEDSKAQHLRLAPKGIDSLKPSSLLLQFQDGTGTLLPIFPDFVGTVVVKEGRVASVNYTPLINNHRYESYQRRGKELAEMKANAAVASRQGQFKVDAMFAEELADQIRQFKSIDPTMGIYAAYSYAQVGLHNRVSEILYYMRQDQNQPVPFDVVMLDTRNKPEYNQDQNFRFAPFAPVLSQGWSLLMPDHPLFRPIHGILRTHLVPSLWTTYTAEGVEIIREALLTKQEQ